MFKRSRKVFNIVLLLAFILGMGIACRALRIWKCSEDCGNNNVAACTYFINHYVSSSHLAHVYTFRGDVYRRRNDFSDAIRDYNSALERDPKYVSAYVGLAVTAYFKGNLAIGDSYIKTALSIDPDFSDAYCVRGIISDEIHHDPKGWQDIDKAQKLNPSSNCVNAYRKTRAAD